jgi:hypothetical protein
VRETHRYLGTDSERLIEYRADGEVVEVEDDQAWNELTLKLPDVPGKTKWRPSIFMPRWASRITLEVVNIRVERVQDISEWDAMAEGIRWDDDKEGYVGSEDGRFFHGSDIRTSFQLLWDSINAKRGYGWDSNPWCWVVEFRKVEV